MPAPFSIDVSSFETVDWQSVADTGVILGITKIFQNTPDPTFRRNWEQIRNAGLLRGAYFFLSGPDLAIPAFATAQANALAANGAPNPVTVHDYPDPAGWAVNSRPTEASVQNAVDQAIDLLNQAGGLEPGDLPLILDAEDQNIKLTVTDAAGHRSTDDAVYPNNNTVNRWDYMVNRPADLQHLVSVALARMEQRLGRLNGRRPMIYMDAAFWNTIGGPAQTEAGVNFSEYPLWLASYTPVGRVRVPAPWLGSTSLLWQYTDHESVDGVTDPSAPHPPATCDASKLMTVAPDPAHAGRVILTESSDATPIEALCAIEQRTNPVALARKHPLVLTAVPANSFNLLFVTQGYWADEIAGIVGQAWDGVHAGGAVDGLTDIPPFNAYRAANQPGLVAHFDAAPGVFLGLRQRTRAINTDELTVWPDAAGRIKTMLGHLQVHIDAPPGAAASAAQDLPAGDVWPVFPDQTGVNGTLVAVLRKPPIPAPPAGGGNPPNLRPAELYQVDPGESIPVPMVAVNVTGSQWPRVLARAIGQILGGLGDEYELDSPDFAAPAADLVPPYAPNLVYLAATARTQLDPPVSRKVLDLIPNLNTQWDLPPGDLPFLAHKGAAANPDWSTDPAFAKDDTKPGTFKAMEGGGGYLGSVLRSDYDCLMRRMPSGVAATMAHPADLPIQSSADFCQACLGIVRRAGALSLRPRIRIDSQRLLFDTIKWPKIDTRTVPFQQTLTPAAPAGAVWSCTLAVTAGAFSITDIKLDQRDDPYSLVSTAFSSLVFQNLSVTLAGSPATQLAIATALADRVHPPKLETAIDGGADNRFQIGIKLTLSWTIPAAGQPQCLVDGILSVVFKAQASDADPQGFARGCRIYPQLALRARPAFHGVSVSQLQGTVRMVAANAIPAGQTGLDPALQPLANGKIVASLITESNSAGSDSTFAAGAPLRAASGRKLAGLVGVGSPKIPTSTAPPLWSWRFDYARPLVPDPPAPPVFAVVHRANEPAHAAAAPLAWPAGSAFQIALKKEPRQGDYDSLYIHPDRGKDAAGNPIVAAPVCADLGILLFLRRGLSAIRAPRVAGPFLGWGNAGREDQGARSVRGAPFIPPNQHVDLTLHRINDGQIQIDYAATIAQPGAGEWQVILEQGLVYCFKYVVDEGLTIDDVIFLGKITGAVDAAALDALRAAKADTAHPAVLDASLRAFYQALYPKLRFYDTAVDTDVAAGVQQAPDVNGPPAALEKN